jgi:hypothetical protein
VPNDTPQPPLPTTSASSAQPPRPTTKSPHHQAKQPPPWPARHTSLNPVLQAPPHLPTIPAPHHPTILPPLSAHPSKPTIMKYHRKCPTPWIDSPPMTTTMTPTLHTHQPAPRIPAHPSTSLSTQTAWRPGPRTPTTGYAADSSGPYTPHHSHLWSSNTIPTVAVHLASCNLFPTSKQWPNTMTALQTTSPSATDSVTGAVQAALGLYISATFLSPSIIGT